MVANNNQDKPVSVRKQQAWSWFSLLATAVLLIIGIWTIAQRVTLAELINAFAAASPLYILLSFATLILTLLVKSWRWQILLTTPTEKPPFPPVFWAFNLGAFVNLVLPFMRLGEIARLFAIDWMAGVGKARALGTLVVEKLLDLIMVGLSLLLILPSVILPNFVTNPLPMITAVSLLSLFSLYILAFQTGWIIKISRLFARWLPGKWEDRVMRWLVSGLEGLDALRHKRQTLVIIGLSAVIALLTVSTPYLLFLAFHLELGIVEAALLNIIVILAIAPPSTPGKIGILNGTAALTLFAFGLRDEAVIVSYSTIYYLVIVLPLLAFGAVAVSRTHWKWQKAVGR
ncbi:MAG: flippase-like domain-containing protein [Anaerolineae bacterium]|nr:flippase-like domain-containing protein [Anaerolineae bacterium]